MEEANLYGDGSILNIVGEEVGAGYKFCITAHYSRVAFVLWQS